MFATGPANDAGVSGRNVVRIEAQLGLCYVPYSGVGSGAQTTATSAFPCKFPYFIFRKLSDLVDGKLSGCGGHEGVVLYPIVPNTKVLAAENESSQWVGWT